MTNLIAPPSILSQFERGTYPIVVKDVTINNVLLASLSKPSNLCGGHSMSSQTTDNRWRGGGGDGGRVLTHCWSHCPPQLTTHALRARQHCLYVVPQEQYHKDGESTNNCSRFRRMLTRYDTVQHSTIVELYCVTYAIHSNSNARCSHQSNSLPYPAHNKKNR